MTDTSIKKEIIAFEKNGVRYEPCSYCPASAEKFISTTKIPLIRNGVVLVETKRFSMIQGLKWILANGYKPIYK